MNLMQIFDVINLQNVTEGPSRDVQTDKSTSAAIVEYKFDVILTVHHR